MAAYLLSYSLWCELLDRSLGEHEPDDRGRLDDRALLGREVVESRGEQSVDRRRDLYVREVARRVPDAVLQAEVVALDEHRQQLLGEERIAFGGLYDPVSRLRCDLDRAEEVGHHALGFVARERCEGHTGGAGAFRPALAPFEDVGPRGADQQQRRVIDRLREMLDEVEERGLGPVD